METTGRITDISVDYKTKQPKVVLELHTSVEDCEKLKDMELSVEMKKYRKKRSLNANNYAWKLINEIGNEVGEDKNEVYKSMLRKYGQSELISVIASIPLEGYIKYFDEAGESILNGKLFKHYRVYKGSSEFDTKEMSVFIDGITFDCKELGIETVPPEELESMVEAWKV